MRKLRTLIDKLVERPPTPVAIPSKRSTAKAVVAIAPPPSVLNDTASLGKKKTIAGIEIIDCISEDAPYWGELPQELLNQAIADAETKGIEKALKSKLREAGRSSLMSYIFDVPRRSAWLSIFGEVKGELAMDVGCGYGANTIALSRKFETVVATDMILERLVITGLRLKELGITNVILVRTTFDRNPLKPSTADLICCNGVIEWIGSNTTKGNIDELQQNVLALYARSLSDDGQLYVGIENRFGLASWAGAQDHSGLRFTSLLPRKVADFIVRFATSIGKRKAVVAGYTPTQGYRTYTHSPKVWRNKLEEVGLGTVEIWGTNDYNLAELAIPLGSKGARTVLQSIRASSPRSAIINNLITQITCIAPSCLLIRASKKRIDGLNENVTSVLKEYEVDDAQVVLADLHSRDAGITRFVINAGGANGVLKQIESEYAGVRSKRSIVISPDGTCVEEQEPRLKVGNNEYVLELFRSPCTLLHSIPPKKGWEMKAMKQFATWAPHLLQHLSHGEREWTQADSSRLLLIPLGRIRKTLDNNIWPGEGIIEAIAEELEGKKFVFGEAHGDLVPENCYPSGNDIVIEDWNNSLQECPIGVDACMYAFSVASKRKGPDCERQLVQTLASLKTIVPEQAYETRKALLAIAILNWRGLSDSPRAELASEHAMKTLRRLVIG